MRFAEEFAELAEAASPRLRRTAFLLCGDWHTAEDLVQSALAKVFVSWRKIRRQDAAHSYATRTLINCYLADKRLKRPVEVLTDQLPERVAVAPPTETRLVLLAALAALPLKARAVVVLRYWTDLSVEEVAAVLGCSPGNVRSQSSRALCRLRAVLGDALSEAATVAFSPNGKLVAMVGAGAGRVMSVATHHQIGITMDTGFFSAFGVAFTPDGTTLVTTDADGTIRQWSVATHRQIRPPIAPKGRNEFGFAALRPDGKVLVTTQFDGPARLWTLSRG